MEFSAGFYPLCSLKLHDIAATINISGQTGEEYEEDKTCNFFGTVTLKSGLFAPRTDKVLIYHDIYVRDETLGLISMTLEDYIIESDTYGALILKDSMKLDLDSGWIDNEYSGFTNFGSLYSVLINSPYRLNDLGINSEPVSLISLDLNETINNIHIIPDSDNHCYISGPEGFEAQFNSMAIRDKYIIKF
jgi:hypothetical protein